MQNLAESCRNSKNLSTLQKILQNSKESYRITQKYLAESCRNMQNLTSSIVSLESFIITKPFVMFLSPSNPEPKCSLASGPLLLNSLAQQFLSRKILQNHSESCWILQNLIESHRILQNLTESFRISQNLADWFENKPRCLFWLQPLIYGIFKDTEIQIILEFNFRST